MARILIADDQQDMRDSLAATLAREGHEIVAADDGAAALSKLQEKKFDLLMSDLRMPKMTGIELLAESKRLRPEMPVILMTAFASVQTAVEAMKMGAYDYLQKPFDGDEVKLTVERTLEHARLRQENQVLRGIVEQNTLAPKPLIGEGSVMSAIRERIERVARSNATVLIRGESGTGKEVASRMVHAMSERRDKPFLAVNCAALSETLLESELFGHEKGAFTGADKMRRGRFELADGGTLLLDEISEISPAMQAKLLRVLQESVFERVGSSVSLQVDVRVIATSNRQLEQSVKEGKFREDLFYRLNVVPIDMPPLRKREEDIPELVRHFLTLISRRDKSVFKHIEPEAVRLMQKYPWPGNVREMQNLIERAVILETDPATIRADTIAPWLTMPTQANASGAEASVVAAPANVMDQPTEVIEQLAGKPLADIEKKIILSTLKQFKGHRIKTATALGIGVRTLGLKLKKWRDEPEAVEVG
jgi:two-component system, NtrC family, response regulator HydG